MRIKAKKIPKEPIDSEDTIAEFCFYFPQYTYQQACKLPQKRIIKMLRAAERERAKFFFELTQIVTAPHTKKGAGVKKLLSKYEGIIKR